MRASKCVLPHDFKLGIRKVCDVLAEKCSRLETLMTDSRTDGPTRSQSPRFRSSRHPGIGQIDAGRLGAVSDCAPGSKALFGIETIQALVVHVPTFALK